jgi:hypothetical protein
MPCHQRSGRRRDDFPLRHHRVAASILRAGLRDLGLYERGAKNARVPILRPLRFEFEHLPDVFDGFRTLHLSDLHIDGLGAALYLSGQTHGWPDLPAPDRAAASECRLPARPHPRALAFSWHAGLYERWGGISPPEIAVMELAKVPGAT